MVMICNACKDTIDGGFYCGSCRKNFCWKCLQENCFKEDGIGKEDACEECLDLFLRHLFKKAEREIDERLTRTEKSI